jgi:hypothetical protein
MELSQGEKVKMSHYLLGQLSEPEQQALEESIFADGEKFYQLCEIEDQLIDSYARNQLRQTDRALFEECYLRQPARRKLVEFALTLTGEFDRRHITNDQGWRKYFFGPQRRPALVKGLAVATLVFLAFLSLPIILLQRSAEIAHRDAADSPSPSVESGPTVTTAASPKFDPQPRLSPSPQPGAVLAIVTLSAFTLRGETNTETAALRLASGQTAAQIHVRLPDQDYPVYEAGLKNDSGQIIKRWHAKPTRTTNMQLLVLPLTARLLTTGDYTLIIEARSATGPVGTIASLPFKVVKSS